MKRPTWATIVGILGIVFGCFGILGGGQSVFMPKMMEMQKEMLEAFEKTAAQQRAKERAADSNDADAGPNKSIPFPVRLLQKYWRCE